MGFTCVRHCFAWIEGRITDTPCVSHTQPSYGPKSNASNIIGAYYGSMHVCMCVSMCVCACVFVNEFVHNLHKNNLEMFCSHG